jgi:hypothetical protein
MAMQQAISVDTIRELCLRLPETNERPSHGRPAFFVRDKKPFVMFMDHHHDSTHVALWCAAPEGAQQMLVSASPEHYFRPPYVGHRGWIGVYLDTGIGEDEVAGVIEDAYLTVAPTSLVKALEGQDLGDAG